MVIVADPTAAEEGLAVLVAGGFDAIAGVEAAAVVVERLAGPPAAVLSIAAFGWMESDMFCLSLVWICDFCW